MRLLTLNIIFILLISCKSKNTILVSPDVDSAICADTLFLSSLPQLTFDGNIELFPESFLIDTLFKSFNSSKIRLDAKDTSKFRIEFSSPNLGKNDYSRNKYFFYPVSPEHYLCSGADINISNEEMNFALRNKNLHSKKSVETYDSFILAKGLFEVEPGLSRDTVLNSLKINYQGNCRTIMINNDSEDQLYIFNKDNKLVRILINNYIP